MSSERRYCSNGASLQGGGSSARTATLNQLTARCTMKLAGCSAGRIALHLFAMAGDRCVRFHVAGILRELPWISASLSVLVRACERLTESFIQYLAEPPSSDPAAAIDAQSLAPLLKRGDVLLSDGNTR